MNNNAINLRSIIAIIRIVQLINHIIICMQAYILCYVRNRSTLKQYCREISNNNY